MFVLPVPLAAVEAALDAGVAAPAAAALVFPAAPGAGLPSAVTVNCSGKQDQELQNSLTQDMSTRTYIISSRAPCCAIGTRTGWWLAAVLMDASL